MRHRLDWSGLRFVKYSRISDTDDLAGVLRQDEVMDELLTERGARLVGSFQDNDISASRFTRKPRPDFDTMMRLVEAGEADAIFAYDIDRLYRNRREFAWLAEWAEHHAGSVAIVSLSGDYDLSSPDGRFKAGIMVEVAMLESEKTSRRQRLNNAALATHGDLRKGGRRTFGWKEDGVTPEPAEAAVLIKAWADIKGGASLRQISREWEAEQVPPAYPFKADGTPRPPVPWTRRGGTIRNMLVNPHHVGDLVYQGEVVVSDAWDGIIDRDDFNAVLAILEQRGVRAQGYEPGPRRRTPFTGLLYCGRCEDEKLGRGKAGTPGRVVWRCHECNLSVMAAPVEEAMDSIVREVADDPAFRAAVAEGEVDDDGTWAALQEVEDQIAATDDMWAHRQMTRPSYVKNMARLNAERADLQARWSRRQHASGITTWMAEAGSIADRLDDVPDELHRAFLHAIIDRVTIKPATRRGRTFDPDRIDIELTEAARVAVAQQETA